MERGQLVQIISMVSEGTHLQRSSWKIAKHRWNKALGVTGVTGVTLQVGLNKEDRADPEEQKRREMISWIQDMLSNLEKASSWVCFLVEPSETPGLTILNHFEGFNMVESHS